MIRRTGEEGVVSAIIDEQMVEVEIDGTVFPVFIDQIDHPYLKWFTDKGKKKSPVRVLREQIPVEKPQTILAGQGVPGVFLTFMPEYTFADGEEQVDRIKVFCVNRTEQVLTLTYRVRIRQGVFFELKADMQPFSDLYLHFIGWTDMQEIPRFEWHVQPQDTETYAAGSGIFKLKSAKLFEKIEQLKESGSPTFHHVLLESFAPKVHTKLSSSLFAASRRFIPENRRRVHSVRDIPRYELDLHIEHLSDQHQQLSREEKLALQLDTFEYYVRLAIVHRQEYMVVIHGIGEGVLKEKVLSYVRKVKEVAHSESGFSSGYGFGATVLRFRY